MKIHVGVDRESKTVHSLVTTPANVHDSRMVERLLHRKENAVFGDSAYMGKTEEIKGKAPDALDLIQTRGTKNKKLTEEDKEANRLLSKTRSRVEHIFLIAKKVFGFSKVRYKGLPKNTNFIFVLFLCRTCTWSGGTYWSRQGRSVSKKRQKTGKSTKVVKNSLYWPK